MKYNSRAISLNYFNHGEHSIIAKMFTEEKGVQTFIVKGVRKKKSKNKLGFFQPLQLSQINGSYNLHKKIQYLNDVFLSKYNLPILMSLKSSLLCQFVAEILTKLLQENEIDKKLFLFIWRTKISLNNPSNINANFPLNFLLNLAEFLGIRPSPANSESVFFDLKQGQFISKSNANTITKKNSLYLNALLIGKPISIAYKSRNELLKIIIKYYKTQDHEIKNMTSHLIIETLRR